MKPILPILFTLITTLGLPAQKFLQMEKYGSPKVKKFYIGDELTYKIKDYPDDWTTATIEDLLIEDNIIVFSNRTVRLEDIIAIRKDRRLPLAVANSLYTFGLTWGVLSLLDGLTGNPLKWSAATVPATAFTIGFLAKRIFKHRNYRMGKRRWLRMLEVVSAPPIH
ncbi:MAG TPA: hypothetical protein ENJ45_01205 [Phaeodactylibacter sp.]|nr:hypothetical protein [Phaeodactylibacter sp.]